jgi:hypothetical protein
VKRDKKEGDEITNWEKGDKKATLLLKLSDRMVLAKQNYSEEKGMKKNSMILRQVLEVIDQHEFQKSVAECEADWHGRQYKSWDHLVTQMLAQITGVSGLRELCLLQQMQEGALYHLGTKVQKRSTISDAGFRIPYQVFEKTFYRCLEKCNRVTYRAEKGSVFKYPLKIWDSTEITLGVDLINWKRVAHAKGALKLHYEYDLERHLPCFLVMTEGKVHDVKVAKEHFTPQPDSIYIFDRGYKDYHWYYSFYKTHAYFVTRLQKEAVYQSVGQHQKLSEEQLKQGLLYDLRIKLRGFQRCKEELRLIGYIDPETRQEYEFLTNQWTVDAYTITQLYKARWTIEIFFKWIKQNLKIKSFLGTSRNAILSQIWCAMLYYLCLSYIKFQSRYPLSLFYLHKIIKATLFKRTSLWDLLRLKLHQLHLLESHDTRQLWLLPCDSP